MKNKTLKKTFQNQEGQIALFIVFVIMALLLFIALFLTNAVIKQTKVTRNSLNSIQAYYLADMGSERALYGITRPVGDPDKISLTSISAPNVIISRNNIIEQGSSYIVIKKSDSPVGIKISGVFRETSRAIELSWD